MEFEIVIKNNTNNAKCSACTFSKTYLSMIFIRISTPLYKLMVCLCHYLMDVSVLKTLYAIITRSDIKK